MEEGSSAVGYLTTTGGVTGNPHRVLLRLVWCQGRIYASRRDNRSDWRRIVLRNPAVAVDAAGQCVSGIASLATDCELLLKISQTKNWDRRNIELRTVIEITPRGAQ